MSKRAERRRQKRRGTREDGGGDSSRTFTWILGGAAALALVIVVWNVVSSLLDETVRQPIPLDYASPQELLEMAEGVERGDPDAPIRIMEFADYQCPGCREFFRQVKPVIDMSYVQEGTARFVFFDFPIGSSLPHGFLAARAARCAGDQDHYWEYHDRLFQSQAEWSGMSDPVGRFEDIAGQVGLDRSEFRSCLRSDRHARVVSANRRLGEELGVQATPTVIVDTGEGQGIRISEWSVQRIREVVDEALERIGDDEVGEAG